jgi:hypothetical protein
MVPRQQHNWRLAMLLFRAYYDSFIKKRLSEEVAAGNAAVDVLEVDFTDRDGRAMALMERGYDEKSMDRMTAEGLEGANGVPNVLKTETNWAGTSVMILWGKVLNLAAICYSEIGLQLSINNGNQHRARGAFLDAAWTPLGDVQFIKRVLNTNNKVKINEMVKFMKRGRDGNEFVFEKEWKGDDENESEEMEEEKETILWYASFGEDNVDDVMMGGKKELGEDPSFFDRPLVEQIASDNNDIQKLLQAGFVPRKWRSWLITMYVRTGIVKMTWDLPAQLPDLGSNISAKKKIFIRATYVGKDIFNLGGDWEVRSRTSKQTYCAAPLLKFLSLSFSFIASLC